MVLVSGYQSFSCLNIHCCPRIYHCTDECVHNPDLKDRFCGLGILCANNKAWFIDSLPMPRIFRRVDFEQLLPLLLQTLEKWFIFPQLRHCLPWAGHLPWCGYLPPHKPHALLRESRFGWRWELSFCWSSLVLLRPYLTACDCCFFISLVCSIHFNQHSRSSITDTP